MVLRRKNTIKVVDYEAIDVDPPKKTDIPEYDGRGRMRLSVSRMQQFAKCGYAFKLGYVDKLIISDESEALGTGKVVHDLLYNAAHQPHPEVLRSHETYQENSIHYENFIAYENAFRKHYNSKCLFAELELYDPDDHVVLYIDRVNDLQDGTVEIMDYKTGALGPLSKHRFQLALYSYYIEKITHYKVSKWSIFYTKHNKIKSEVVDRKRINMVPEFVRIIREQIDEEFLTNGFNKRPTFLCNWCVYRHYGICDPSGMKTYKNIFGLLDVYSKPWGPKEEPKERVLFGGIRVK